MPAADPPDSVVPQSPSEPKEAAKRTWSRRLRRLAIRAAVVYIGLVVILSFLQRMLIYHPARSGRLPAAEANWPGGTLRDVAVETHDGLTLHGWHLLPAATSARSREELDAHLQQAKFLVLYFHGNAGNRQYRQFNCDPFLDNGGDVFLFDYRGYGENPGKPNEADFLADGRAIWRYAVEVRRVPAGRIVLFGESLGSGVAVPLAAEMCRRGTPPAAVVLWGAFSSLADVGAHHYPWLPVRWVLQDRYASAESAQDVICPIVQLHGEEDRIVPPDLGRKLFVAFPDRSRNGVRKRWISVPHTGHNDFPAGAMRWAVRDLFADRPD